MKYRTFCSVNFYILIYIERRDIKRLNTKAHFAYINIALKCLIRTALKHAPALTLHKESRYSQEFYVFVCVQCNDYYSSHLSDDLFYFIQKKAYIRRLFCVTSSLKKILSYHASVVYFSFIVYTVQYSSSEETVCCFYMKTILCDIYKNLPFPLNISIGLLEKFLSFIYKCIVTTSSALYCKYAQK